MAELGLHLVQHLQERAGTGFMPQQTAAHGVALGGGQGLHHGNPGTLAAPVLSGQSFLRIQAIRVQYARSISPQAVRGDPSP